MAVNLLRVGGERQINLSPYATRDQFAPDVAALGDGRFLVAYQADVVSNSGGMHIIRQLVNADGTLAGGPLDIAFGSTDPAVASRLGNTAIVVFEGSENAFIGPNIRLALFSTQGNNITPGGSVRDAVLGTGSDNKPNLNPDVTTFANGQSIIVWQHDYSSSDHDIHARVLGADGSDFTTADRLLIDFTVSLSDSPAVAASGNKALIVYEDTRGTGNNDIRAVLFDAATGAAGSSVVIADKLLNLSRADVAALKDGRYVVVYEDYDSADIYARFVNASGDPTGAEIVVARTSAAERFAKVAALPDGGFVVTWMRSSASTGEDIFARRFVSDGSPGGDAFRLSSASNKDQLFPAIAVNKNGRAFFAFEDDDSRPGDADPTGVRGGAFQAAVEVINGTLGPDKITSYNLGESINGGPGDDIINAMGGNDFVFGGDDDDTVNGGNGNDRLKGERGVDTVSGGAGNDSLNGGQKKGTLSGGPGLDRFEFNVAIKGSNTQTITDFAPPDDTIVLDASKFKKLDPGPLKGKDFFKGSPKDGNDHVGIKGKKVIYDSNGDKDGGATVIFVLANSPDGVGKGEFLVVA